MPFLVLLVLDNLAVSLSSSESGSSLHSNLSSSSSFPTLSTLDDGPQSRPSSSGSGFSGIDQSILSFFFFMDLTELFIAISSLWSNVPVSNFFAFKLLDFGLFGF